MPKLKKPALEEFTIQGAALALGVSTRTIHRRMSEGALDYYKDGTRTIIYLPEYDAQAAKDKDVYDIAVEKNASFQAAKRLRNVVQGTHDPIGDWVQKATSKGVTFSFLKQHLEIKSLDKARKVLRDTFDPSSYFIIETELAGDTHFMPVPDNSGQQNLVNIDVKKKQFRYYVAPSNNYVTVEFDSNLPGDEIKIYHLTDVHIGSKYFREELFDKVVDQIAADPMAFAVLGGDMIEVITKASVGDPMEQSLTINQQVVAFVHKLMRIAHKIIFSVGGNHDQGRTFKTCETDLAEIMAAMLKVPYSNVRTIIDLHFRGVMKRISLTHRYGNAYGVANIKKKVADIMSHATYHVDFYASGHSHDSFHIPVESIVLTPGKGFHTERSWIVNGGSFTTQTGSYSEVAGYQASPQDQFIIKFNDQGRHAIQAIEILHQ